MHVKLERPRPQSRAGKHSVDGLTVNIPGFVGRLVPVATAQRGGR